jgi:hypothetical protein
MPTRSAATRPLKQTERPFSPPLTRTHRPDVLAHQVDALPQRLTEMKLMRVCDHASVIDHRRRA